MAIKYLYVKRCKMCDTKFYNKEISQQQFVMLAENPNIYTSFIGSDYVAEILTHCSDCADLHYTGRTLGSIPG